MINSKDAALSFLSKHPTLPSEIEITEEEYELYVQVIDWFIKNPDLECISLIVNSHRNNSSPFFEQGLVEVLLKQNAKILTETILHAIQSNDEGIKESGVFFAGELPSSEFINPLINILRDTASSDELINSVINSLESIGEQYKEIEIDLIIEKEVKHKPNLSHIFQRRSEQEWRLSFIDINWDAHEALKKEDYPTVVELLEPYDGKCPESVQRKLDTARNKLKISTN